MLIALGVCNQSVCSARSIQDRRLEVLSVEESHEILAPEMRVIEALTWRGVILRISAILFSLTRFT